MRKEGGDNSWFPAVQNSVRSVSLVLFVLKAEVDPIKTQMYSQGVRTLSKNGVL